MTNNFQNMSNDIVSDFLQSVVFIDDKAYMARDGSNVRHDFDVKAITKSFASNKKICSIFQPEQESDIELFSNIAKKADVTVLDWQIIIDQCPASSPDSGNDGEDDEDVGGLYTKQIIGHLLKSPSSQNSLKLILIYTGETNLESIAQEILQYLNSQQVMDFNHPHDDTCCVESGNFRILVRAKSNGGSGRGKHNTELQSREVSYEDLPKFIDNEFSKLTNGLLSNFALQALTEIRRNYFQILNIFSKKLDAGYLTHQSLLQNGDDANELLVDLLGDTFTSILRAQNLNTILDKDTTDKWIEQHIVDEQRSKLGTLPTNKFKRDKDLLKSLLVSSKNVDEKVLNALVNRGISKSNVKSNFNEYAFSLFHRVDEYEAVNKDFSLLCQHKDLIKYDNFTPTLTLGTVVKSTRDNKYYICIQQRCDSVRLKNGIPRRFLFLSLSLVPSDSSVTNFDLVTAGGEKLRLDNSTYDVRTIKFCGSDDGSVKGLRDEANEKVYFKPCHYSDDFNEKLEFFFELKNLYSQRIIDKYSSNLSRIGLDDPEWIRRSNKNKS